MITSSVDQFRFQPERIAPGEMFHYIKSGRAGNKPRDVYIYWTNPNHIEVLKIKPNNSGQAFVVADLDWENFCVRHIDSLHMFPDGSRKKQASADHLATRQRYEMWLSSDYSSTEIEHEPTYNYNFDFIGANVNLMHWAHPENAVEVGIVEPNWPLLNARGKAPAGELKELVLYNGTVTIQFEEVTKYKGRTCRKYIVEGPGLPGGTGYLWADMERQYFVNFEHPYRDNPSWNDFKFEFQSIAHMDETQWQAFCFRMCRDNTPDER